MNPIILFYFLFSNLCLFGQNKVALHVNILGDKSEVYRYYHPIEGVYDISQKHLELDKQVKRELNKMIFIQPIDEVKDSAHVNANSLRYYIDTKELIYVKWGLAIGVDSMFNEEKIDSFKTASNIARNDQYKRLTQEYFNPFHIARYEVTNAEY